MCRILAMPPGSSRDEAIKILNHFCKANTDGIGTVHVNEGRFIVKKWPKSLHWVLKHNDRAFLRDMPHNGWTLVHLRAASHGGNFRRNTHPFIVGKRAIIHNGVWSNYNLVAKAGNYKLEGETDTEVAAHFLNQIGLNDFTDILAHGGVFMSLGLDGSLEIAKTSGDLVSHKREDGSFILASELAWVDYGSQTKVKDSWSIFDKNGKYVKHKLKESSFRYHFKATMQDIEDFEGDAADSTPKVERDYDSLVERVVATPMMGNYQNNWSNRLPAKYMGSPYLNQVERENWAITRGEMDGEHPWSPTLPELGGHDNHHVWDER